MTEVETNRQFVTALARGLEILRAFRRGERWLAHRDFVARTGLPKATVSRLTYTLARLGYLEPGPASGQYALGAGVLALGYAYLSGLPLRDVARPLLAELADSCRASVVLGAREQEHMVCLELCQGHPLFRLNLEVGMRVPHDITALGRAHLCGLPEAQQREWMQRYRVLSRAQDWPALLASIEQAREDYRQYGFCFSLGAWNPEVYAVGVPLVTGAATRGLVLSLSGPVFNMTRERLVGELGPHLLVLRERLLVALAGNL